MKKILSLAVVLCLLFSLFSGLTMVNAASFTGVGSGTDEDPYVITNAEEFKQILANRTAVYKIEANTPIELDNTYTAINGFAGKLIGTPEKNEINLSLDKSGTTDTASIFASVTGNVTIDNIVITGSVNGGNATSTSALIGYINTGANAVIRNITNRADVTLNYNTGNSKSAGLIGMIYNNAATDPAGNIQMINCVNYGNVTNTANCNSYHAGLIGYIGALGTDAVTITGCRNYGDITGGAAARIGGLIGLTEHPNLQIKNCANLGNVTTGTGWIGGLLSNNAKGNVTFENCFNAGTMTSGANVGGLAYAVVSATFKNCFNAGTVTTTGGGAGGLIYNAGRGTTTFENCYNVGTINGTNVNYTTALYSAYHALSAANLYYLSGSCAKGSYENNATALSASALQASLPTGFSSDVWTYTSVEDGNFYRYPQLKDNVYVNTDAPEGWNTTDFAGGNGTGDFPYQIAEKAHLMNVSKYPSANFVQTANIEEAITEPVCASFSGSYDGNGKFIQLNLSGNGLFTTVTGAGSSISNLTLKGSVTGTGSTVGAFASEAVSTSALDAPSFINCVNEASVTTENDTNMQYVAGIVGSAFNGKYTKIQNCVNVGKIEAVANYVAGIAGVIGNRVTVVGCANHGEINGFNGTAGIVGFVYSTIENCYNTGNITGSTLVGAIGGQIRAQYGMENCYNLGTIKATDASGYAGAFGVCTHNAALIFNNCYNAGEVIAPFALGKQVLSHSYQQGSPETVTPPAYVNCYALTANAEADGLSDISGVTAVTPAALKTAALGSAFSEDADAAYPYPQLTSNPQSKAWDFALLTVSVGENGTASLIGSKYVKDGISYAITFMPEEHYELDKVLINAIEQPDSGNVLSVPINGDTTVSATFAEKQTVAPSAVAIANPFLPDAGNSSYTFATILYGYGYEVTGYGILYSENQDAITNAPETCKTVLEHVTSANAKGQFGIQLIGELPASGYYTRAYVTYKNTATQEVSTVYSDRIIAVK